MAQQFVVPFMVYFQKRNSTGKLTHRPVEFDLGFLAMDVFEFE